MEFTLLGEVAKQYLNTPYIWGGSTFLGLDCSGFVVKVLQDIGMLKRGVDFTAQGLYDNFSNQLKELDTPDVDCLLFFGKSKKEITHVGISINRGMMIHAGGGDSTCINSLVAAKKDARVKLQKIAYRTDLVAILEVTTYNS